MRHASPHAAVMPTPELDWEIDADFRRTVRRPGPRDRRGQSRGRRTLAAPGRRSRPYYRRGRYGV